MAVAVPVAVAGASQSQSELLRAVEPHSSTRMLATAHVAEAAAAFKKKFADLIEFFNPLLDVALVDAATLIPIAAPAGEIIRTYFVYLLAIG